MNRVAAIQMVSSADVDRNLAEAGRLLGVAREGGARLAALPENFAYMGRVEADKLAVAEAEGDGPIQAFVARSARELGLWIVAGTIPLRTADPLRVAAACLVFDAMGRQVVRYDKIHLFDVSIPGRDERYFESSSVHAGTTPVCVDTPLGRLGLAVCYDLRFPELFRSLLSMGAEWFCLPSAFTAPTGRAHWEVLLRARAIENQCWVIAANQHGPSGQGHHDYGHSMIVDPWGTVVARASDGERVVTAEIDLGLVEKVRREMPCLEHARLA